MPHGKKDSRNGSRHPVILAGNRLPEDRRASKLFKGKPAKLRGE